MNESTTVSEKVPSPHEKKIDPVIATKTEKKSPAEKGEKKQSFRGKNAYLCYKDSVFKDLIANNKGKTHKEIMALVGENWKKMSDEEKKPYQELSKKDIE